MVSTLFYKRPHAHLLSGSIDTKLELLSFSSVMSTLRIVLSKLRLVLGEFRFEGVKTPIAPIQFSVLLNQQRHRVIRWGVLWATLPSLMLGRHGMISMTVCRWRLRKTEM